MTATPSSSPHRLRVLYRLQQIDTDLARTEAHLAALDPGDALRARQEAAEAALAAAQRELAAVQARSKDLDLELQSALAKRKHVEGEMYSGRVRNPKELAAMQEDVAALGRHVRDLEDAILALMEDGERLTDRVRELSEEARHTGEAYEEQRETYAREQAEGTSALDALRQERERVAAAVEEDLLRRYDRIRERMGPVAVAAVRRGVCEGCHVAIPEGRVRRLQEEEDLILTCERCGRILVLPEE